MPKLLTYIFALAFFIGIAPSHIGAQNPINTTQYYPFRVDEKAFTAEVNISDPKIDQLYNTLFKKYGYMGNIYTWESLMHELISENDVDFSVTNDLDIIPEGATLTIRATSWAELQQALKAIQPTMAVISKLEAFVKTVFPSHIKDGHETAAHQ